jgi:hypothetical protein
VSATSSKPVASPGAEGPSLSIRVAAVTMLIALAALAAYAMFSGPTTISVKGPTNAVPSRTAPADSEGGSEPKESGRGD